MSIKVGDKVKYVGNNTHLFLYQGVVEKTYQRRQCDSEFAGYARVKFQTGTGNTLTREITRDVSIKNLRLHTETSKHTNEELYGVFDNNGETICWGYPFEKAKQEAIKYTKKHRRNTSVFKVIGEVTQEPSYTKVK